LLKAWGAAECHGAEYNLKDLKHRHQIEGGW